MGSIKSSKRIPLSPAISLMTARFNEPETMALLYLIFKASRDDEMMRTGWSEAQIDFFLGQQFQLQHRDYTTRYKQAAFYLVEYQGEKCGRLYLDVRDTEILVVDISLLGEFRDRGIGTSLLNWVKDEARALELSVTLHVTVFNRCQRLYRRLGFSPVSSDGMYTLMRWRP